MVKAHPGGFGMGVANHSVRPMRPNRGEREEQSQQPWQQGHGGSASDVRDAINMHYPGSSNLEIPPGAAPNHANQGRRRPAMAVTLAILPPSWVPGAASAIYTVLHTVWCKRGWGRL